MLPAQKAVIEAAIAISSRGETVTVCVPSGHYGTARRFLPDSVRVVDLDADDAWLRDSGCTFVVNDQSKEVRGVHWTFNAWGGKKDGCYLSWDKDLQVGRKMLDLCNFSRYACETIMEGGSFHVDGQGTLITTEECLLHPNRSPDGKTPRTKQYLETVLCEYLNVSKVIWLPKGLIFDDDTNGHVDNFCSFVAPATVLLAWTKDETDPQFAISSAAEEILKKEKDAMGRKLTVVRIPVPPPLVYTEEEVRTTAAECKRTGLAKVRNP